MFVEHYAKEGIYNLHSSGHESAKTGTHSKSGWKKFGSLPHMRDARNSAVPMLQGMRNLFLSLVLLGTFVQGYAQAPAAGANWDRVKALAVGTKMHVSGDKVSRTCNLVSVDDEQLVCEKGRIVASTAHYSFPKGEVKTVKLTRYAGSTLGGMAIGAGAGALIGVAATQQKDTFLNFNGLARAAATVTGAVAGGLVAGPTDLFRGPTVYRRPK